MFELGWISIAALVVLLVIAIDTLVRYYRRPAIIRRIFAIHDELKDLSEHKDKLQDADVLARQELLYAEAARLLWKVGIDFGGALREIEQENAERRAACGRLLEINEEFHQLALQPDVAEVIRREELLYREAVRLLRRLDLEPSKYLKRGPKKGNR